MNILFFLIPKNDVTYVYDDVTVQAALELMERDNYSAIPIISKSGKYIGTLTEGDLLWGFKHNFSNVLQELNRILVTRLPRKKDNLPVSIDANIEDLISMAINQNFIPVVDDDGNFIGIVTRKDIIQYCYRKIIK